MKRDAEQGVDWVHLPVIATVLLLLRRTGPTRDGTLNGDSKPTGLPEPRGARGRRAAPTALESRPAARAPGWLRW
jgi:hypothetical protein